MAQTFMPYKCFIKSSKHLDYRRLGKQRVEANQILDALQGNPTKSGNVSPWKNRALTNCWSGYEDALKYYINCMIKEWIWRGYKNNMQVYEVDHNNIEYPWWVGSESFHSSHKSILFHKMPKFYSRFRWWESDYPVMECCYKKLLDLKPKENSNSLLT